ncbi:serine/threonine-protein kinase [Geitlerinema sp. PCC 9228]|uniref:serine/threonine-protein kinase n=1 Tax=Geitlerinema sp. PCC 9228 TaxID=111611 RepID=UPI0008F9D687|nr:serine/threonine-protein kinase [Geitlerinema sp. PCC 9228]
MSLVINDRYQLIRPLRPLDARHPTELWQVTDGEQQLVMKLLKDANPKRIEAFEREAFVLQRLSHPGIPKVDADGYFSIDAQAVLSGENHGNRNLSGKLFQHQESLPALVMEWVEGDTLESWLQKYGPISQKTAINWLQQLAEILRYLHSSGFFHRDIKPENIICRPDGKLMLIDFGSVREMDAVYLAKISWGEEIAEISGITAIVSAGYTPPEQVQGKAVPQSDFFALGRTLVRLLAGQHPAQMPQDTDTGRLLWREQVPELSAALGDLLDEMMAPSPGQRPQTAQAICDRLQSKNWWVPPKSSWLPILNPFPKLSAFIFALLLGTGTFISFFEGRPWLFQYTYNRGVNELQEAQSLPLSSEQRQPQVENARWWLQKALWLRYEPAKAHYSLGQACLEVQDFACAAQQFRQATSDPKIAVLALNNLGYVSIKQKKYQQAEEYLSRAWQLLNPSAQAIPDQSPNQDSQPSNINQLLRYTINKNYGWALLEQGDLQRAAERLRAATTAASDRAAGHCLLAQVKERQGENAIDLWQQCYLFASPLESIEEKEWLQQARQKLDNAGHLL